MKHIWLAALLGLLVSGLEAVPGWGVSDYGMLDNQDPSLSLIAPNGGENWSAGSLQEVLWYAGDSNLNHNSVQLWLSLDDGQSYQSVAEGLPNTLSYLWQIPNTLSSTARMRIQVSDIFGNQALRSSAAAFSIGHSDLAAPQNLAISISGGTDAMLSWDAVTHYLDGTPVTPTGYLILYSSFPVEDIESYQLIGATPGLSFIHQNAIVLAGKGFYCVIAYLDDDAMPMSDLLPAQKLSLRQWRNWLQRAEGKEK